MVQLHTMERYKILPKSLSFVHFVTMQYCVLLCHIAVRVIQIYAYAVQFLQLHYGRNNQRMLY